MRLAAIGRNASPFSVSHMPPEAEGWLELLAAGLAFDLAGLKPAAEAPVPEFSHAIGLDPDRLAGGEAIALVPGDHLAGGRAMLPVVRMQCAIAARLAGLDGACAVAWHPARTMIAPVAFVRMIDAWLGGGAFPALGLTALSRHADGGFSSEGLAFFIGQELQMDPGLAASFADAAKLAVRLIHALVENGPLHAPLSIQAADGTQLWLVPAIGEPIIQVETQG